MESSLSSVIVATEPRPDSVRHYWIRHRRFVPMTSAPVYGRAFESILDRERANVVIPSTDFEWPLFAENFARWEVRFGTHIIVNNPSVVQIAADKHQTNGCFRDREYSARDSCLSTEEVTLFERDGFELNVKPCADGRSVGILEVQIGDQLARTLASGDGPALQDCVATERREYTVGTLAFEGRYEACIVKRRDLQDERFTHIHAARSCTDGFRYTGLTRQAQTHKPDTIFRRVQRPEMH